MIQPYRRERVCLPFLTIIMTCCALSLICLQICGASDNLSDTELSGQRFVGRAVWSPDCKRIMFRVVESESLWSILSLDANTGNTRVIVDRVQHPISRLSWSPLGNRIAFTISSGAGLEDKGDPRLSLKQITTDIYEWDASTLKSELIIRNGRAGSYSPNGRYIAYVKQRQHSYYSSDIWLFDTKAQNNVRLFSDTMSSIVPLFLTWSPDSNAIVFDCASTDSNRYYDGLCAWRKYGDKWTLKRSPFLGTLWYSSTAWHKDSRSIDYFRYAKRGIDTEAVRWNLYSGKASVLWRVKRAARFIAYIPNSSRVWLLRSAEKQFVLEEYDLTTKQYSIIRRFDAKDNENLTISWCPNGTRAAIITDDWIMIMDQKGEVVGKLLLPSMKWITT